MNHSSAKSRRARGRRRLRILIAVSSVVVAGLLGLLIDSALYYNKVHAGVTISGRSVSGLTRDEATAALTSLVTDAQNNPITLVSGQKTWPVRPTDVGTKIDIKAAVAEAIDATRGSNSLIDLFRRFTLYFAHRDIALHGTIDSKKMDSLAAEVAEDVDMPPVNAGLVFEGTDVKVIEGQKGRVVDKAALRDSLKALLLTLHTTKLTVPMVVREPAIKAEDSEDAIARAKTMIGSSVTLRRGGKTWKLTPEQIAAYMDFTSEDRDGVATLVPYLSSKKMEHFLEEVARSVDKKAVNASFKGDGQKAWVVAGATGVAVDAAKTAAAVTAACAKSSGRVAEVAVKTTQPSLTSAEAERMGIREKLGSFSTNWIGTPDRQTNVRITTEYASNVILAPGETYNFDEQVGPRTAERGYKMAPGIQGGKLEDVFGGGICQVATTLFNAAFFAGLDIVERKNHSLYVSHYPKGRDATVSAESPNLRFKNDTGHHVLVRGASDGINTTFVIYGTDDGRSVSYTTSDFYDVKEMTVVTYPDKSIGTGTTEIKTAGQTGQALTVVRTVKAKNGSVIHKDEFYSTWKMIPREILVGTKGKTTTTKKPATTTTTVKKPTSTTTATTEL